MLSGFIETPCLYRVANIAPSATQGAMRAIPGAIALGRQAQSVRATPRDIADFRFDLWEVGLRLAFQGRLTEGRPCVATIRETFATL
jgi:hypothetical protein